MIRVSTSQRWFALAILTSVPGAVTFLPTRRGRDGRYHPDVFRHHQQNSILRPNPPHQFNLRATNEDYSPRHPTDEARLQSAIRNNFQLNADPRFSNPYDADSNQLKNLPPMQGGSSISPYEIEKFVRERLQDSPQAQNKSIATVVPSESDDEGRVLDEATYLRLSRSYVVDSEGTESVQQEQSFNKKKRARANSPRQGQVPQAVQEALGDVMRSLSRPSPVSPDVANLQNRSLEEMWTTWEQASKSKTPSNDLHEKFVDQEKVALEQSKVFRESLTDSSKSREAWAQRHGGEYERRQSVALSALEQKMEEFEALVEANKDSTCPRCKSMVSPDELERTRQRCGEKICNLCYSEQNLATPFHKRETSQRSGYRANSEKRGFSNASNRAYGSGSDHKRPYGGRNAQYQDRRGQHSGERGQPNERRGYKSGQSNERNEVSQQDKKVQHNTGGIEPFKEGRKSFDREKYSYLPTTRREKPVRPRPNGEEEND